MEKFLKVPINFEKEINCGECPFCVNDIETEIDYDYNDEPYELSRSIQYCYFSTTPYEDGIPEDYICDKDIWVTD